MNIIGADDNRRGTPNVITSSGVCHDRTNNTVGKIMPFAAVRQLAGNKAEEVAERLSFFWSTYSFKKWTDDSIIRKNVWSMYPLVVDNVSYTGPVLTVF